MVRFSIISVCWNNLSGLVYTGSSVQNQDFEDFEWIVIDGNSTDGTKQWLEESTLSKLKWSSEPDKGIFDAMNKGLRIAKGQYLIFMNSGDSFAHENVLSSVSQQIGNQKKLFVYGDSLDVRQDGKEFTRTAKPLNHIFKGMYTQHQAIFFNRLIGSTIKYRLEYPITADYAYISEYYKKMKSELDILYFPFPICKFSLGGINEQQRFKALSEDFFIRTRILNMTKRKAAILYVLHFAHTLSKRFFPGLLQRIRYR